MTTAGPEGEGFCPAEGPATPPTEERGKQSRVYVASSKDGLECLQVKSEMLAALNSRHRCTFKPFNGIVLHHPRGGVVVVKRRKRRIAAWEVGERRRKRWKKAIGERKS